MSKYFHLVFSIERLTSYSRLFIYLYIFLLLLSNLLFQTSRSGSIYIYRFLCTYELECVCVYFLFLSSSVMLTSAAKYFFFFSFPFRLKSTMYIIEYRNAFLSSFEATTTIEFYIYTLESRLMIYFWLSTHRRQ